MKAIGKYLLIIFCLSLAAGVAAQDKRLTFMEKLRIQEEEERAELEHMVETASDLEYSAYSERRLLNSFDGADMKTASVIIGISTADKKDAQPSAASSKKSVGVIKLERILELSKNSQASPASSQPISINNAHKESTFEGKSGEQFEQVKVSLNSATAMMLIKNSAISDILVAGDNPQRNTFTTVNTDNGRFYPTSAPKKYDDVFLKKGYFDELIESFEKKDRLIVFVGLKGEPQDSSYISSDSQRQGHDKVDAFLSGLDASQYKLVDKGPYFFVVETDKNTAETLFNDDRVRTVNDSLLYSSRVKIDIN